ncbi:hypothetical protein CAEBREN_13081 [Caenorhabditis brenneri]|uniref:Uncharacterized protein n=1 Tax=Caenorhabditis brenneri TaxID=135651 RepID=G0P513_CAEBE|nr:hypothetical protein CAEBREN_13081 [Caenorhabditis brenneri]
MSDKTNNPTENVEIDQENIKPGVKMVSKKGQKAKGVDKVSVIHVAESVTSPEKAEQPEKVEESVIPEDDKMEDDKKSENPDKEISSSEDGDDEKSVNGSTVDDEEDKESVADESAGNQKERMESTIQQMLDSMDGLPKSLYGVKLEEAGSASMAHQIVMHSMLISLNKQVGSMVSENSLAADQVKSIHDMLKTIHDSQKEGLEEWKKATVAEAKKWRQEAKQEAMKKESAQDNEIARLQKMLQELINDRLTSAVQQMQATLKQQQDYI